MIVSRIALCLPRDRALDDVSTGEDTQLTPGGRWIADRIVARLREMGATIPFLDALHYWSIEILYQGARFQIVVSHPFPYECSVHLLTRRSLLDRILREDHREVAESLFSMICELIRAESRAGPIRTWRGPSRLHDEQRFITAAVKELEGDNPLPGVVRVDRPPRR